jgi:hypothetical protein
VPPEEDDELEELGFSNEALLTTLSQSLGEGLEAKLPPRGRFLMSVARVLRKRLAADDVAEQEPAIFFFRAGRDVPEEAEVSVPLLRNGLTPVASCLWFMGEVAVNVHAVEVDEWDDATVFADAIEGLQVGGWPAVIFDPRPGEPEVLYCPDGIGSSDSAQPVALDVESIELNDLFDRIDFLNERYLASPGKDPQLWEKQTKWWPIERAEKRIQEAVEMGLQMAYPTCDVRAEQPGALGRVDIEVYMPISGAGGKKTPGAVLELKVLRSFGSTGDAWSEEKTRTWIYDGVIQAASYRDERSFPEAALCCFDMRKAHDGEACFAHVITVAADRKVVLRAWPIFNSTSTFRKYYDATKYAG